MANRADRRADRVACRLRVVRWLEPHSGKSTAAEIQALMGTPVERQAYPGETVWWYPRGPAGWHSYAVYVGSDGSLKRIEQRLTVENVRKVVPNTWTKKEVRELFGPPFMVSTLPRLQREVWEYQLLEVDFKWNLWVQFSPDGVVREVLQVRHPAMDPPGASTGKD
jgi:outer membrane protein assembly factor BamE (lipoprotein component of BamABCDE complex)